MTQSDSDSITPQAKTIFEALHASYKGQAQQQHRLYTHVKALGPGAASRIGYFDAQVYLEAAKAYESAAKEVLFCQQRMFPGSTLVSNWEGNNLPIR